MPGVRKSGMPAATETPAPERTRMFLDSFKMEAMSINEGEDIACFFALDNGSFASDLPIATFVFLSISSLEVSSLFFLSEKDRVKRRALNALSRFTKLCPCRIRSLRSPERIKGINLVVAKMVDGDRQEATNSKLFVVKNP